MITIKQIISSSFEEFRELFYLEQMHEFFIDPLWGDALSHITIDDKMIESRFSFNVPWYLTIKSSILHIISENSKTLDIRNKITFLINRGIDINELDFFGRPPLFIAIQNNNSIAISTLIHNNADVNCKASSSSNKSIDQMTPFLLAAKSNNIEALEKIVSRNPKFDDTDSYGITALHFASEKGDTEVVEFLIKNMGAFTVDLLTPYRQTPLHFATKKGYTDIVNLLLKHNANPNLLDTNNQSALHFAVQHNDASLRDKLAKMLINADGYPNQEDIYGDTPLHLAAGRFVGNKKKESEEVEQEVGEETAASYSLALVQLFLTKLEKDGINPIIINKAGRVPLHYAATYSDDIEIIKLLGGEDQQDNMLHTPLHAAAANGKLEFVKYFIEEKNINIEIEDKNGCTPLIAAIAWFRVMKPHDLPKALDLIAYMLEKGANIEHIDADGKTPIFHAIETGNEYIVRMLFSKINPKKEDIYGRNILFYLIMTWCSECRYNTKNGNDEKYVKLFEALLKEDKFDINERDNAGKNLLFYAIKGKYILAIEYLIGKGVNPWISNEKGFTPFSFAQHLMFQPSTKSEDMETYANICNFLKKYIPKEIREAYSIFQFYSLKELVDTQNSEEQESRLKILDQLISIGADVNSKLTENSETAIFFAIRNREIEMIQLLLHHQADVYLIDGYGRLPFDRAALDFLKEKEVNPRFFSEEQIISDFHLAEEILNFGRFPLHEAVSRGDSHQAIVTRLLNCEANPNIEDENGIRPIDIANQQDNSNMRKLLIYNGAIDSINLTYLELYKEAKQQKSPVIWTANLDIAYSSKSLCKTVVVPAVEVHKELRAFENLFRREIENTRMEKKISKEKLYNREQGEVIVKKDLENFAVATLTFIVSDTIKSNPHGRCYTKPIPIKVCLQHEIIILSGFQKAEEATLSDVADIAFIRQDKQLYLKSKITNRCVLLKLSGKLIERFDKIAGINRMRDSGIFNKMLTLEELENITLIPDVLYETYHVKDFLLTREFNAQFIQKRKQYVTAARNAFVDIIGTEIILDKQGDVDFENHQKSSHSEQALYEYLELKIENIIREMLLGAKLKNKSKVEAGFKVYALILDVHSTREMCGNCVERVIGMQCLSDNEYFKSKLNKALDDVGLFTPKEGIRIFTRISSNCPTSLESESHVPSPDDQNSTVKVFIKENEPMKFDKYEGRYVFFRKPLDIKETRNCLVLASSQEYTSKKFSRGYIQPKPKYTIFTTQEDTQSGCNAVYKKTFHPSSSGKK